MNEQQIDNQTVYSLGQRDAIAIHLAESMDKGVKEPELAQTYKEHWGDHFSLSFHLS